MSASLLARRFARLAVAVTAVATAVATAAVPAGAQILGYGQSFTTAATNTFLQSVFAGDLACFAGDCTIEIYALSAVTPAGATLSGAPLFSQAMNVVPRGTSVDVNTLLDPLTTYGFFLRGSGGLVLFDGSDYMAGSFLDCTDAACSATLGGFDTGRFSLTFAVSAVPEPGTWALLGTGLLALGVAARRKRAA